MVSTAFHLRLLRSPSVRTFLLRPTHIPLHYPHCHCHCQAVSTTTHHRLLILLSSVTPLHIRRSSRWESNGDESYGNEKVSFDTYDKSSDPDENGGQWDDVLKDYIDSIWILKVFGSFGLFLPIILVSMLLASGPKSFLIALAIPMGQSTFGFAIQRFIKRGNIKPNLKNGFKRRRSRAYTSTNIKDADRFGNEITGNRRQDYRSQVSRKDTTSSRNYTTTSRFGGWDELDSAAVNETESSKNDLDSTSHFGGWDEVIFLIESKARPSRRGGRKWNRPRARNEQQEAQNKWNENVLPCIVRVLIFLFPFLSSWIEML